LIIFHKSGIKIYFTGYSGNECEIDDTTGVTEAPFDICTTPTNPCLNGGVCFPVFNIFYTCECPTGVSGVNCETQLAIN
jgi:hypothetical protein